MTTPSPAPGLGEVADRVCDHDWSLETDWDGDPNVINGTRSWKVFRCPKCGDEREATHEEIRDYEDARRG